MGTECHFHLHSGSSCTQDMCRASGRKREMHVSLNELITMLLLKIILEQPTLVFVTIQGHSHYDNIYN